MKRNEVTKPAAYDGPYNHTAIRNAVEEYVRGWVGPTGRGIRVGHGTTVRMIGNTFVREQVATFDYTEDSAAW